ncbi:MAG: cation-translocating P-type ATPase [Rikenellaceae bacterium]
MKGLNDQQVQDSRNKHGENIITPPKRDSILKLFLEKFEDPIIKILIVAAFLSIGIAFVDGNFTETIGIITAIILSISIGFWFEWDAGRKFDILNSVNDQTPVRVIRNGQVTYIDKKDVVVGDIVMLESGEEVPADGKLLESLSLGINESSLTGELFVHKTTIESEFDSHATYASNMLLRGTMVVEGNGIIEVEHVGDATEYGGVAIASTANSAEKTPLTKQLDKLAGIISIAGASISFTVFAVLFIRYIVSHAQAIGETPLLTLYIVVGSLIIISLKDITSLINNITSRLSSKAKLLPTMRPSIWYTLAVLFFAVSMAIISSNGIDLLAATSWLDIKSLSVLLDFFMIAVSLIVMAVPEGLPMSITLSLALNMRRMLKSNNLVRKMHACETMGAINVICTDKTGTLTQNVMTVSDMVIAKDVDSKIMEEGIAVNSTSHLDYSKGGERPLAIGNPTESALLLWLATQGVDYKKLRESHEIVDQLAFSSEKKCMLTLTKSNVLGGSKVLYIKGAPEVILAKSNLTPEQKKEYEDLLSSYQRQAKRTLAFGYAEVEGDNCDALFKDTKFNLLGVVSITDPIRTDVPGAIKQCLDAGIKIKIVTGDTPATAIEIARQIGLWDDESDTMEENHITGTAFAALSDEELFERVLLFKIISRARPSDKQRLVQTLQKKGYVTAVTGDGTNDAPALNFANVGLSMGSGTSVAKEASDITIIDDSFTSISMAVMWGRSLYRNIQRFILFQLTINVIALGVFLIGVIFGSEPPLTITQILWVNIIMDTIAAAALASLPPVSSVMQDKPRKESDFIISKKMASNIFGLGGTMIVLLSVFLYFLNQWFTNTIQIQTIFFTTFVMVQFWNMFNAKVFQSGYASAFKDFAKNRVFFSISTFIVIGQIAIVNLGGEMFRCAPLSFKEWILIISCTSIVLIIGEVTRFFKRMSLKK